MQFDPNRQVFEFTHIPKCGGTTIHKMLEKMMQGNYVHCYPGSGWEGVIDRVWGAGGHQMRGENPINLHEGKEVVRCIIFREPLQRFLSWYRHIQDHPKHYMHQNIGGAVTPSELAQYCEDFEVAEFLNLQARYVVGPHGELKNAEKVIEEFNKEFAFYSVVEMIPDLTNQLARFFKTQVPKPKSMNVSNPIHISDEELKKTAEIVYRNNYFDLRLYHAACSRLLRELR